MVEGGGRYERGPQGLPPLSSSTHSWFNSYTKLMQTLSGAPLPPSVDIPYSVPIQDWSQMVSWWPTSYLCWLLMQILYRTNRISLWHPRSSSSTHFLFNSYAKLMYFLSWSTFAWPLSELAGEAKCVYRWGGEHIYIYIYIYNISTKPGGLPWGRSAHSSREDFH